MSEAELFNSTKSLKDFYVAITKRLQSLSKLDNKIDELEDELFDGTIDELITNTEKLQCYKMLTKIHLEYIEAIRRVFSAIDLETLFGAMGLIGVLEDVKKLDSEGMNKIRQYLKLAGSKVPSVDSNS